MVSRSKYKWICFGLNLFFLSLFSDWNFLHSIDSTLFGLWSFVPFLNLWTIFRLLTTERKNFSFCLVAIHKMKMTKMHIQYPLIIFSKTIGGSKERLVNMFVGMYHKEKLYNLKVAPAVFNSLVPSKYFTKASKSFSLS